MSAGREATAMSPPVAPALRVGERYTINVDQAWNDAEGRPLASPYRKSIRIVEAVDKPLRLADWRIEAPRAGTRDPIAISVPWPLDHALFERTVGVTAGGEPIQGKASVQAGDLLRIETPGGGGWGPT